MKVCMKAYAVKWSQIELDMIRPGRALFLRLMPQIVGQLLLSALTGSSRSAPPGVCGLHKRHTAMSPEDQARCDHDQVRRYGNAHGKFAKCTICGIRWRRLTRPDMSEVWEESLPSKPSAYSRRASAGTSASSTAANIPEENECPECGATMSIRRGASGEPALIKVCTTYPKCRGRKGIVKQGAGDVQVQPGLVVRPEFLAEYLQAVNPARVEQETEEFAMSDNAESSNLSSEPDV
jgi:hypothetical protein